MPIFDRIKSTGSDVVFMKRRTIMKRKTAILSLVLTLALVFGAFQVTFANKFNIGTAIDGNEYNIETAAFNLMNDTADAGYKLVSTDKLAGWVDSGKDMLIVDTMPAGSWSAHRVPGAVNVECGDNGPNGEFTDEQKAALLKAVRKYSGYKPETTYYWNTKIKKWSTKKPSSKNWGKCTRKGDKYYGKKTKTIKPYIKDKTIVIYCGFVKCKRSHAAAAYLVENGYTKVYRYPGGIEAWGDAELAFEGTDAE